MAKPSFVVSHEVGLEEAVDAYDKFDRRVDGYTKVSDAHVSLRICMLTLSRCYFTRTDRCPDSAVSPCKDGRELGRTKLEDLESVLSGLLSRPLLVSSLS